MLSIVALLACSLEEAVLPARGGLVYEVYVRSFQDSDDDGVGDLEGLRGRLPYVASLGTDTLWLMPVFPGMGPGGYDVTDFDTINQAYGDESALYAVVADAHALGMEVLLDLPLNHTGSEHPWFVAAEAGDSDMRDRYLFARAPSDENWYASEDGSYYAYFGPTFPDLDWREEAARAPMLEVFDRWLEVADGYRLDAVITLVEDKGRLEDTDATHALLAELYARAGGRTLLAEASMHDVDGSFAYLGEEDPESDLVLDFPRNDALIAAFLTGDADLLRDVVDAQGPQAVRAASFLGSHDVSRLSARLPSVPARRAAMVAHLLLPGRPVLYYGEEIDLPEADDTCLGQDWCMRAPMAWTSGAAGGFTDVMPWFTPDASYADGVIVADELQDPDSMLALVTTLGQLRADSDAVRGPAIAWLGSDDRVLAFERTYGDEVVAVTIDLLSYAFEVRRDGVVVVVA
jgi:alpha-glucosidase